MSQSRNSDHLSYQTIIRPFVQTAATAISVALVIYPFEYCRIRKQLPGTPEPGYFLKGISRALIQSGFRNVAIAQKDMVHREVNKAVNGESEKTQHNHKFGVTMLTSSIIGFMDTAFTNYYCNWRIFLTNRQKPVLNSFYEKMRFGLAAFNIRYARNMTSAFFCVGASTLCKDPLNHVLPKEQAYLSPILSNIFFGAVAGILTNGMAVLNVRQVAAMDMKSLKVPSIWEIAKKVMKEEGAYTFRKGASYSVMCTILAYLTIEGVSQSMDYLFAVSEEERKQRLQLGHKMFASKATKTANTPVIEVFEEEAPAKKLSS